LHAQSLRLFSDLGIKHGTASALAGLAAVAGLDREYARAARLLGAAEGIWCAIEGTPDPFQRRDMEVLAWDARRALTADRYQAEWEAGRAMSLEETVARALGEIE
jgi:hypothetical protein